MAAGHGTSAAIAGTSPTFWWPPKRPGAGRGGTTRPAPRSPRRGGGGTSFERETVGYCWMGIWMMMMMMM